MADPTEAELVGKQIAQAAPGCTYGKNVRIGPPGKPSASAALPNSTPEQCVFILPIRGKPDQAWKGGGGEFYPEFQVWVRGTRGGFDAAYQFAWSVWRAVDKRPPPGYFEARASGSGPEFFQLDDQGCPEFLFTLSLRKQV